MWDHAVKTINIGKELKKLLAKVVGGLLLPRHGMVNRNVKLAVNENEKLFKQKYNIISVIHACC